MWMRRSSSSWKRGSVSLRRSSSMMWTSTCPRHTCASETTRDVSWTGAVSVRIQMRIISYHPLFWQLPLAASRRWRWMWTCWTRWSWLTTLTRRLWMSSSVLEEKTKCWCPPLPGMDIRSRTEMTSNVTANLYAWQCLSSHSQSNETTTTTRKSTAMDSFDTSLRALTPSPACPPHLQTPPPTARPPMPTVQIPLWSGPKMKKHTPAQWEGGSHLQRKKGCKVRHPTHPSLYGNELLLQDGSCPPLVGVKSSRWCETFKEASQLRLSFHKLLLISSHNLSLDWWVVGRVLCVIWRWRPWTVNMEISYYSDRFLFLQWHVWGTRPAPLFLTSQDLNFVQN